MVNKKNYVYPPVAHKWGNKVIQFVTVDDYKIGSHQISLQKWVLDTTKW